MRLSLRQISWELADGASHWHPALFKSELASHYPKAYRLRNRIERYFNRLKYFRRIVIRYDRRHLELLAALYVVGAYNGSLANVDGFLTWENLAACGRRSAYQTKVAFRA
jgi:hypothetical protein